MIDHGLLGQLKALGWVVECPESFGSFEGLRPEREDVYKNIKNIKVCILEKNRLDNKLAPKDILCKASKLLLLRTLTASKLIPYTIIYSFK